MTVYIDYMDFKNNFKPTRQLFRTYEDALKFMIETFDRVDTDLIKYL
jgi:hypothetical protein